MKMLLGSIILLQVFLLPAVTSESQYFIEEPADVTANIGDAVTLQCRVGNREGVLQWTKNGFGLGTDPALPGFSRYTLTEDFGLQINPVSKQDVGEFQCQVGAGDYSPPIRSRAAKITVQLPPGEPKILGGENGMVSVNEGETGLLECESAGGKPAAKINWSDESGKPLRIDSVNSRTIKDDVTGTFTTISSLRFPVDQKMHNKTVVCSAANIASTAVQHTKVRVNVMYRPKVALGINTGAGMVKEGSNVVLHCQADANPVPYSYTWTKNGVIVPGEMEPYLALDGIDNSYHLAEIQCEAKNSLGSAAARTILNLQYKPIIIEQPRSVSGKEGEEVTLTCKAKSNPPARYIWFKEDNPQPIEFSDTLKRVVSSFTAGRYKCQAIVEGFDNSESQSALISVLEAPAITRPESVAGYLGEDAELTCTVLTPDQNINITWYYRGKNIFFYLSTTELIQFLPINAAFYS